MKLALAAKRGGECTLCGGVLPPDPVGFDDLVFCDACLEFLGSFALQPTRAREALWPSPGTAGDLGDVFAEFKRGLEKVVDPQDVGVHADLSFAYREMGLLGDAIVEAAIALNHATPRHRTEQRLALRVLLQPPSLKVSLPEALEVLREHRSAL